MKNNKYWLSRAVRRMFERMAKAEKTANIVAKIYKKALLYLLGKQEGIFKKYMVKYGLTMTEAKRLLNTMRDKTSVDELMQKLNEAKSSKERQELKKELETAAYRARLERLQDLQDQIDDVMQNVFKQEKEVTTEHYIDLAEETYAETMYDVQQETGLGFSFAQIDPKQIKRMLNVNWSGSNYASRIWGNTRKLAQRLKEELIVSVITGRTERDTAEIFKEEFARGASDARRLIRTESSYISSQIEMESYKECEIEQYRYLATLDLRTSKVCRELDGKVFLVSEQKPGKNCPPMHPWCRSTTTAVVSEEAFRKMKRRARDPKTGKTYTVPASMTYKEWYSKYIEGSQETKTKEKATLNRSSNHKNTIEKQVNRTRKSDANNNFNDVTRVWLERNKNSNGEVVELSEYTVGGETYVMDGRNVSQNNSPRELEVAQILKRKLGWRIELIPEIKGIYRGIKTPDYVCNGERWDLKELKKGTSKNLLRDTAHKHKDQAENFIFDITSCALDYKEINRQAEGIFKNYNTEHVKRVMLIRGDEIIRIMEKV